MADESMMKSNDQFGGLMGPARVWTSLPLDNMANRRLLSSAMLPLAPKLDTVINTVIHIANIVLQPITGTDEETGEVDEYLGITLICTDGSMYWTGSKGIAKSIQSIALWAGMPPWKDGVSCKVIQSQFTRKDGQPGRSYYLEPVFADARKSR